MAASAAPAYRTAPAMPAKRKAGYDWPIFVFCAVIAASVLFSYQLSSLTVVIHVVALGMLTAFQFRKVARTTQKSWFLIIPIGWIFLSTLWSQYPGTTFYYATETTITVLIGIQIGRQTSEDEAFIGLFFGWSLYTLASLMFGHSVKWGAHGGSAFSGLAEGKNYAGDTAVLGFILSLNAIAWAVRRSELAVAIYAAALAIADLFIIAIAQSSGAIIGVTEVIATYIILTAFMLMPRTMRAPMFIVTGVLLFALFITRTLWLDPVSAVVMQFFGKDPTLTGRVYLWARADDITQSHPWLGVGYNAFWVQGNLNAEGLWRSEGILGRSGFNFHNSMIEWKINFGIIGMIMVFSTIIALPIINIVTGCIRKNRLNFTIISILVYELCRAPFESIGLVPFSYTTILIIAVYSVARSSISARSTPSPKEASNHLARPARLRISPPPHWVRRVKDV